MGIEGIPVILNDRHGDIGAVVTDSLTVDQHIGKDEAKLDGTVAAAETDDVTASAAFSSDLRLRSSFFAWSAFARARPSFACSGCSCCS